MNDREKALKALGDAWTGWNLDSADDAPYFPEDSAPHKGFEDQSDYEQLALDRSASADLEADFWERTKKARKKLGMSGD